METSSNRTTTIERNGLARRLCQIRIDLYGEDGIPELAEALGLPARTWANYELGVTVPAPVVLRLIALTGVRPHWLLTGEPPRYDRNGRGPCPNPRVPSH